MTNFIEVLEYKKFSNIEWHSVLEKQDRNQQDNYSVIMTNRQTNIVGFIFCLILMIPPLIQIPNSIWMLKLIYWGISHEFELKNNQPSTKKFQTGIQNGLKENVNQILCTCKLDTFYTRIYSESLSLLNSRKVSHSHYDLYILNNKYLTIFCPRLLQLDYQVDQLAKFQQLLHTEGIDFLYVQAPHKIYKYAPQLPLGIIERSNENMDNFVRALRENGVEVLDCREIFRDNPEKHYEYFYKGDTHWKATYAFLAFAQTAELLTQKYGFEIDSSIYDIKNYRRCESKDQFRNDIGCNLENMYPKEKEDFFEPTFDTEIYLNYAQPEKQYLGKFDAERKFFGGVSQNSQAKGKKILIFSDSFGIAYCPYLALISNQVEYVLFNKIHVQKDFDFTQISKVFKPDIVIVCMTGRDFIESYFDYLIYYMECMKRQNRFAELK